MSRSLALVALALAACPPPGPSQLPPFCEPSVQACPPTTGSTDTGDPESSSAPTDGIQTVTGLPTTSSTGEPSETTGSSTTSGPMLPVVEDVDFAPDPLMVVGEIAVDVVAQNVDGVRMELEDGSAHELTKAPSGHYLGTLEKIQTGLDNKVYDATFIPRLGDLEGEPYFAQYEVALAAAGTEFVWDTSPDLGKSQVDALAVTQTHVLVLGTFFVGSDPHCFVHRRALDGKPSADTIVIFPEYKCIAEDLVAGDDDTFWLLVTVESGGGWRWRLASAVWGQPPIVLRTGADEVARALARSPQGDLVACGSGPSPLPIFDKIDGRVWRPLGPAIELDYRPNDMDAHHFDETVQDCAFAGEQLRLVGEVYGLHDEKNAPKRKRPFVMALDGGQAAWTVAALGPGNTTQGGATSLAISPVGDTYMGLFTCGDACKAQGELRRYDATGELTWNVILDPDVLPPTDIAWSPAGYIVMASAQVVDKNAWSTKFLLQAYAPPKLEPSWNYSKATLPSFHLAQAVAVSPSAVIGGGSGSDGFWALAFVAP